MPPFIERPSPATTAPAACLPAPAVAGQGVGTHIQQAVDLLAALYRVGLRLSVEAVVLPAGGNGFGDHGSDLLVSRLACALSEVSQARDAELSVHLGDSLQLHADQMCGGEHDSHIGLGQADGTQMKDGLEHLLRCYGKVRDGLVSHQDSLA